MLIPPHRHNQTMTDNIEHLILEQFRGLRSQGTGRSFWRLPGDFGIGVVGGIAHRPAGHAPDATDPNQSAGKTSGARFLGLAR